MTESSIFWATTGTGDGGAGGYSAANLFELFRSFFTGGSANAGGVAPDYSNELAVSGTASPVSVAAGAAIVYGIPYFNGAAVTVAIPTPAAATRVDRIVLRAAWAAQTVRITRIAGTEGAGAPAMTQSAGTTWDIPLATVSITTGGAITVTDGREFLQGLGDGGVTTAKIADNAITNAKMADNAINTAELVNAGVTLAKMANLADARLIGRAKSAGTGVPTALTAAQLITILLDADGTDSLLDADKLDGYQASEFALLAGAMFTGDVGIGVAPGAAALAVNMAGGNVQFQGSAGNMTFDATGNVIALSRNGANYITANGGSSASFGLQTNGATRLTIDGAGTVELATTTGALLIPRLTTTQRDALTPANGMVIYNTTDATLQVYQGGAWASMGTTDATTLLNAIKTVDGTGSGLDADLLDGQSSAYYLPAASYSANDVLTKLKTVDGAGSGLDADTIDGLDGDSGWQSLTVTTNWNPSLSRVYYRKICGIVNVKCYLSTSYGGSLIVTAVGTMPAGYRPYSYTDSAYSTRSGVDGTYYEGQITTAGHIYVRDDYTGGRAYVYNFTYMAA